MRVFFLHYMIELLRLFQKRSSVLSSEHENQYYATIGTLLDQFMLSCNNKALLAFHSVCKRQVTVLTEFIDISHTDSLVKTG